VSGAAGRAGPCFQICIDRCITVTTAGGAAFVPSRAGAAVSATRIQVQRGSWGKWNSRVWCRELRKSRSDSRVSAPLMRTEKEPGFSASQSTDSFVFPSGRSQQMSGSPLPSTGWPVKKALRRRQGNSRRRRMSRFTKDRRVSVSSVSSHGIQPISLSWQ
jgi:hypothetical protein